MLTCIRVRKHASGKYVLVMIPDTAHHNRSFDFMNSTVNPNRFAMALYIITLFAYRANTAVRLHDCTTITQRSGIRLKHPSAAASNDAAARQCSSHSLVTAFPDIRHQQDIYPLLLLRCEEFFLLREERCCFRPPAPIDTPIHQWSAPYYPSRRIATPQASTARNPFVPRSVDAYRAPASRAAAGNPRFVSVFCRLPSSLTVQV